MDDPRIFIPVKIKGNCVLVLLESGSPLSYAGPKIVPYLGDIPDSSAIITVANSETLRVDGEKLVEYKIGNIRNKIPLRVIKTLGYDYIVGMDFLQKFGIIVNFGSNTFRLPGGKAWKMHSRAPSFQVNPVDSILVTDNILASQGVDPRYFLDLNIKNTTVRALVDMGSTRTYVNNNVQPLLSSILQPVNASVLVANNSIESVAGEADIQFSVSKFRKNLVVRLLPSLDYDCVLGVDFLKLFGVEIDFSQNTWKAGDGPHMKFLGRKEEMRVTGQIVGECAGLIELTAEQRVEVDRIVKSLVVKPGKTLAATNLAELKIDVEGHPPIRQNPRRYSPKVLAAAHAEVDKLLAEDIIEPAASPWCSPPVLAPKSDGTYRFCVDFRKLNSVTRKQVHPIPAIDSVLDRLRKARFITKIDMSRAFWQIKVHKDSRDYTAFTVPGRPQYRFRRTPFGLSNAPACYQ